MGRALYKFAAFKEITEWENSVIPNHTYILNNGGKLVAYRKTGTTDWIHYSKPLFFSRRHRKFVRLPEKSLPDEYR